jgi:hypothetical protein
MESDTGSNSNGPIPKFEVRKAITFGPTNSRTEYSFRNYYQCPNDGTTWHDDWNCMCDDRCPTCDMEVEPYESEDI